MARDDFKKTVKDELAKRVGYMCSNPDCAALTSGPRRGASGAVVLGMACHIYAASPGGPRYLASMTEGERSHADNGIWLCRNCGTRVDSDQERFPADLLKRWRIAAEAAANNQLVRPARPFETKIAQLSAVMKAISGEDSVDQFNSLNIALAESLNKLDDRLLVSTQFDSTVGAAIHIAAKRPTTFKINWPIHRTQDIKSKLRDLHDHGRAAELSLDGASVDGSALIEYLFSSHGEPGRLEISKSAIPITINLIEDLKDDGGERVLQSLECEAVIGNISTTITKKFWKDIVTMQLTVFAESDKKTNVMFDFDLDKWIGLDIKRLPYLEKVTYLREAIVGGKSICISLEHEGRTLIKTKQYKHNTDPSSDPFLLALQHLKKCSRVAELLSANIEFPRDYFFNLQKFQEVSEALDLLEGKRKISGRKFTFLMTYPEDPQVAQTLAVGEAPIIKCSGYPLGEIVTIFDQEVRLPPHELIISECEITMAKKEIDEGGGVGLRLEWMPKENFSYTITTLPLDQWPESRAQWGENTSIFTIEDQFSDK